MVAGVIGFLIAPWFSRLSRLFAPVVTGTAMLLIGVSLMGVAVNWIAGGGAGGAPGELWGVALALVVIGTILGVTRFASGFLANTAVLLGIGVGFAVAWALGRVDLTGVATASWFSLIRRCISARRSSTCWRRRR